MERRTQFTDSDDLCRYVRELTGDAVLLALSLGKDSIATWLKLREHFPKVIPIHYEVVPGLRFIREYIAYLEGFFETKVHVYTHPATLEALDYNLFQTPRRAWAMHRARFTRSLEMGQIFYDVCKKHDAMGAWIGIGNRAADSVTRHKSIQMNGPLSHDGEEFFPVYDWKTAHMVEAFRSSGVKLSPDYVMFNRSFDSVRFRFLEPLKRYYPDDYERILKWHPLAEAEMWRRRFYEEERDDRSK